MFYFFLYLSEHFWLREIFFFRLLLTCLHSLVYFYILFCSFHVSVKKWRTWKCLLDFFFCFIARVSHFCSFSGLFYMFQRNSTSKVSESFSYCKEEQYFILILLFPLVCCKDQECRSCLSVKKNIFSVDVNGNCFHTLFCSYLESGFLTDNMTNFCKYG